MNIVIHECQCTPCREGKEHPARRLHEQMNVFLSRLNEQQRRWYVALESKKMGHGGDTALSEITGMHVETIRNGRSELDEDLNSRPVDRIREAGAGRPPAEKKMKRSKMPSLP